MPDPKIYTKQLETFNFYYSLTDFSIEKLEIVDKKFRNLDRFLGMPSSNNSSEPFESWVDRALGVYVDAKTSLRELDWQGADLTQFDIEKFLAEFDKLADARFRSTLPEDSNAKRKPYAGADKNKILARLQTTLQGYNKTLPDLWTERMKSDAMNVDAMRAVTDAEYQTLTDSNALLIDSRSPRVTNVLAAYETMLRIRPTRGFWWKLFNFRINSREKEYIKTLKSQIQELQRKGFDMEYANEKLYTTVLGQKVEAPKKTQEAQPNSQKEDLKKQKTNTKKPSKKMAPVSETLKEKMVPKTYMDLKKMFNKRDPDFLPFPSSHFLNHMVEMTLEAVIEDLPEANKEFDEQITANVTPQEAMETYALRIFSVAFTGTDAGAYDNLTDRIVATQKMTDEILKAYSPCALDPEGLKEFTNAYAVKHSDQIVEAMKDKVYPREKELVESAFNDAKAIFGFVRANISINNEDEANIKTSQQIKPETKSINKPNLNIFK